MTKIRKTLTVAEQQSERTKAQSEIERIRGELRKGEQSGSPRPFDGERFKAMMAVKHAKKSR